ncbi:MAG TPA: hypothetical protein D7H86_03275 [Candidatus Poseidoniales archaeon]|nr:MAG TPA: hypothetical protein D7H86_03275 [Candidatus Poseidoniales archaeon]|tara:strand:- start:956 stop:1234 length:279 start_codon:yes stop_codon:yes gene_type:complete
MDGDDLTLESIVARDISSMKTIDESIQEAEKTSTNIEKPRVEQLKFKQKVDAVETRKEFIMKPKKDLPAKKPNVEILKSPSQQTGDDFDVEW